MNGRPGTRGPCGDWGWSVKERGWVQHHAPGLYWGLGGCWSLPCEEYPVEEGQATAPWVPFISSPSLFCRASVWRIPRALCQRRHLPEPISGTRDLPVSVLRGSGTWEDRGQGGGGRTTGPKCPSTPRCAPGFLGETCQFPDPCRNTQLCKNGGSCQALLPTPPSSQSPTSPLTPHFSCTCPSGFTGDRCQTHVEDLCPPSFCSNGGRCYVQASGRPQCSCEPGWTGKYKRRGACQSVILLL